MIQVDALGMSPLAYGVGSGADMLKPWAIAVIGALCILVLLSLVITRPFWMILRRLRGSSLRKMVPDDWPEGIGQKLRR